MEKRFKIKSSFKPSGDQPTAIKQLAKNITEGKKHNTLLGVTGSGKTFTIANVIEKINLPSIIIAPNKILAAQLYAEFRKFFPENAVEYFISYYDYYQPEAYIPQSDTYIEKDAKINDQIDRLRLRATSSLMTRKDVIIVASVSCIYNLGSPEEYGKMGVALSKGMAKKIEEILDELIAVHYERNDFELVRGNFRVKGDVVDIFPAYTETVVRAEFSDDKIEKIYEFNPVTSEKIASLNGIFIFPAKHFVTSPEKVAHALKNIEDDLKERVLYFKNNNMLLEAQRLEQRTKYDMEMIRETGYCHGIENYSRYFSGGHPGQRPKCLLDYFPVHYLTVIDESHLTLPQIRGMYEGDKSRKETLVEFGFRLPSCLDNRPLKYSEFEQLSDNCIYISATPSDYELNKSSGSVDLIVRPTGLVDPEVIMRASKNQVRDLMQEIENTLSKRKKNSPHSAIIVNALTKKLSEDFTSYLNEKKYRARYLHSGIKALDRINIIKEFRKGNFDILVGVNLLREGLDLPEVVLVAVFDADKEGFLRSDKTLIQISGRAARNIEGRIILYCSSMTGSIKRAINEMSRRRQKQSEYNLKHHITPKTIIKAVDEFEEFEKTTRDESLKYVIRESAVEYGAKKNLAVFIAQLEKEMRTAADALDFELAAALRDKIFELKGLRALDAANDDNKKTRPCRYSN